MRNDAGNIIFIVIAVGIIISEMVFAYMSISAKDYELNQVKLLLSQNQAEVNSYKNQLSENQAELNSYKNQINELTLKMAAMQREFNAEKNQLLQANNELEKSRTTAAASKPEVQAESVKEIIKEPVKKTKNELVKETKNEPADSKIPAFCADTPEKRKCSNYKIQILMGEKYICPDNYTVMDGYPPGGVTGPVCHMNSGSYGAPATCKDFNQPGCHPSSTYIPCYGAWPCSKYSCYNYYNQWFVVKAMPAAEVCGK